MYINFHKHLKRYELQRICPCGACKSAVDLKLKVISHFGEIAEYSVKQHKKLFGKDVIVIHRLLKNNIDSNEYLLMTSPVIKENSIKELPNWFSVLEGSGEYDSGEVQYRYSLLSGLMDKVPPPDLPHVRLSSTAGISFVDEETVEADMNNIFEAIFHLEKRIKWMDGVKDIEVLGPGRINRTGTLHRCIINPGKNPVIVTESATLEKDRMELIEMDQTGMGGCRYILKYVSPSVTRVSVEVLVKKNPFIQLMFAVMMKNRFKRNIRKSLENLVKYCKAEEREQVTMAAGSNK
jgi:hypothetical protein